MLEAINSETILSIREDYVAFANFCIMLVGLLKTNSHYIREEFIFQAIRHGIHDLKPIYSGYSSIAAILKHNGRITHMCREHYHSRAIRARQIIHMIKSTNDLDFQELVDFIKESCKVHYTTAEENTKLAAFQIKENYDWKEAYKTLGIHLAKYDGIKTWYKINGIKYYKTKQEIQDILGLTLYALDNIIEEKGDDILIM